MLNLKVKSLILIAMFISGIILLTCESGLASQSQPQKREKVIDFDGDLVEGMNKRPFDSLSQVSEAQKKRKQSHLYRKRKSFSAQVKDTLRKLRYTQ